MQLFYHVPRLDTQVLQSLCHVCQQHSLEVSTVQYVVQVLHARYMVLMKDSQTSSTASPRVLNFTLLMKETSPPFTPLLLLLLSSL